MKSIMNDVDDEDRMMDDTLVNDGRWMIVKVYNLKMMTKMDMIACVYIL